MGYVANKNARQLCQQSRARYQKRIWRYNEMVAVGEKLGKFSSLKAAEQEAARLGSTSGAQIIYLPATKRYQVQKVVPA